MALDLARESLAAVWHEAQPLLLEHWREIAHFQDIPLEPKVEAYFACDAAGKVRVFTARDRGALVGYAAYMVDTGLHYASSLQATQDVLFLLPAHRNAGNGAALIDFADRQLRSEGVQCVYQHVKLAFDFGPLLKGLGYAPVETIHVRRLDHGN